MSIVEEAPGYIQVFSDGSVKRFTPQTASPSPSASESIHQTLNFKSKDVTIDTSKPITARIFLPDHQTSNTYSNLPLLIYFHGGGFCIGSTTWLGYHRFLGGLSASSLSIIVSVDYCLAPENRLPSAYKDGIASLHWILASVRARSEPWLENADLSRVFLSGDSAGGNIAHNVAVRAAIEEGLGEVKILGLMLVHPYFGSEERTERELAAEGRERDALELNDMFWRLSVPEGENRDYCGCNFEVEERVTWREFPGVVVFVAGRDFLKERGVMYARFLESKGVRDVRVLEAEEESHVFHVFYPESEATRLLQRQMSEFINGGTYC